jgi:NAD(P)H-dependent FMN reductase
MTIDRPSELARFHRFVQRHISTGTLLSPEEALDLWRLRNPLPNEFAENVEALRQALADMDAGDHGTPIEEPDRKFRRRHGLP